MLDLHVPVDQYCERCSNWLRRIDAASVEALARDVCRVYDEQRFVFVCGNGGSGSNASHICEDFGKSTLARDEFADDAVKRLRIVSLTDNTPYILAWANDEGFDRIFVEQLKNLASPGDLLIALSGSGNSPNVLRAIEWADQHELVTWGVTGFDGGQLARRASRSLHLPLHDMGMVESIHLLLFHWILNEVYHYIHSVPAIAGRRVASIH